MFDSYVSLPDGKKRFNKHLQIFRLCKARPCTACIFSENEIAPLWGAVAVRHAVGQPGPLQPQLGLEDLTLARHWGRWGWVGCGDLNCLNIYIYMYIYICWTLFDSVWHCTTKNKGFSNETPKHILKRKRTTTYWQHMMKIIWYPWLQTLQHLQWTSGG